MVPFAGDSTAVPFVVFAVAAFESGRRELLIPLAIVTEPKRVADFVGDDVGGPFDAWVPTTFPENTNASRSSPSEKLNTLATPPIRGPYQSPLPPTMTRTPQRPSPLFIRSDAGGSAVVTFTSKGEKSSATRRTISWISASSVSLKDVASPSES